MSKLNLYNGKSLKGITQLSTQISSTLSTTINNIYDGSSSFPSISVTGGIIDGVIIGGNVPGPGYFTTLQTGNATGTGYSVNFYGSTVGDKASWNPFTNTWSVVGTSNLGNISIINNTISTTSGTLNLSPAGTANIVLTTSTSSLVTVNSTISSSKTTASTSTTTGAIRLVGGIGINNTTDATSISSGGTITTAGGVSIAKSLYVGTLTTLGSSYSGSPFTTSGTFFTTASASTFTDNATAASGTVSQWVGSYFSRPTIAASNTGITYTNAATLRITDAPTAGTNVTITNAYSLWVAGGNINLGTGIIINSNSNSTTSSTTGSLRLSGGIGINNSTDASSTTNGGSFTTLGGMAIGKKIFVGTSIDVPIATIGTSLSSPLVSITGSTASTSSTTGSLTLAGGIGINNSTDATTSSSGGSFTTSGGAAIGLKLYVGTSIDVPVATIGTSLSSPLISITGSTASTSPTTGVLTLSGGIGINNSTDATTSSSGGSFTTSGGMAVGKKIFVGTSIDVPIATIGTSLSSPLISITGSTASTSSTTGSLTLSGGIGINLATDATSVSNGGSFTTSGGMAVGLSLFVGSNIQVRSSTVSPQKPIEISTNNYTSNQNGGGIRFSTNNAVSSSDISYQFFDISQRSDASGVFRGSFTLGSGSTGSQELFSIYETGGFGFTGNASNSNSPLWTFIPTTLSTTNILTVTNSDSTNINNRFVLHNTAASSTYNSEWRTYYNSASGLLNQGYLVLGADTSGCYINTSYSGTANSTSLSLYSGTNTTQCVLNTDGTISAGNTTASSSTTTGALKLSGGLAINKSTDATSASNGGSFTTSGGAAIGLKLYVGTSVNSPLINVTGSTASTSSTTGVLTLSGGIGINNSTDASSISNGGSFTTAGGASIAKSLYVGTLITLGSSYSGSPFTTSGTFLTIASSTFTDNSTAASGTVSQWVSTYHSRPTIAASNTGITYTNAATLRITDAPTAGTNVTITNAYSLWVAGGNINLGTGIITNSNSNSTTSSTTGSLRLSGGIGINNSTDASSTTNGGSFTTSGGAAIAKSLYVGTNIQVINSTISPQKPIEISANSYASNQNGGGIRFSTKNAVSTSDISYQFFDVSQRSDASGVFRGSFSIGSGTGSPFEVLSFNSSGGIGIYGTSGTNLNINPTNSGSTNRMKFENVDATNVNGSYRFQNSAASSTYQSDIVLFYNSFSGGSNQGNLQIISNTSGCSISTSASGTASATALTLSSNSNSNQLVLATDGSISEATTTDATTSTAAAHKIAGGLGVSKRIITGSTAMFGGQVFINRTVNNITSTTGVTLTTSQVIGSYITRSNANAGQTDTLPTASDLVAAITNCQVGTTFDLIYLNTSANAITIAVGDVGDTFYGASSSIAATTGFARLTFVITNISGGSQAYNVFRIV